LHIELLSETQVVLSFDAVAAQSYTLESRPDLGFGTWTVLTQFAPQPANNTLHFTNTISSVQRYYRLATP
jgi:hypothetical protein